MPKHNIKFIPYSANSDIIDCVMKFDFHTHCFPDSLAQRALKQLSDRNPKKPRPHYDGTFGGLKARLNKAGIGGSVVCNISTNPKQTPAVNSFAIACAESKNNPQADFPQINKRTQHFGSIHPSYENYKYEIDRLCGAGIKGLKFHPDYQGNFVDDESVFPIYEYAAGKGMIMLFHTGLDIGLRGVVKSTPDRFINVVNAFRGAKLVAAHMGGYKYADVTEEYLTGKDCYMDTSASLTTLTKKQAERMIKNHGVDKILFATDLPWFSPEKDIKFIDSLNLTVEEKEKIYYRNAEKLLGVKFDG